MTPANIVDLASARSKQEATTGVEGLEVTERTASDWLEATIGRAEVPHSRGEKVLPLRGAPPDDWALVFFGRRA